MISVAPTTEATSASARLDEHVRAIVARHFSPDSGTPFWLDWAREHRFDPASVRGFADLQQFPHFQDEWLREVPPERWVPRALAERPYKIFETGGTTGMPKQRLSWDDHLIDYTLFSSTLPEAHFPRGAAWLMVGPTGPRRLRLSIEHLANIRGGPCYFVDLDPRWVRKALAQNDGATAKRYMAHVVEQAVVLLKNRDIRCLFTTPRMLEAMGEVIDLREAGIRGVFSGGTSMTSQTVRFLSEEVLGPDIWFAPTYGNTLMGLASNKPLSAADGYQLTYYAPQPRAVLRVVDPDNTAKVVDYGAWGRVELATLTEEFFMPRFLERDEAVRRPPWGPYAWDGVGEVRPFRAMQEKIVEGVY
jgi:phenylacetate-coenzyme A ligase PaaK-like adenylate-forming protein